MHTGTLIPEKKWKGSSKEGSEKKSRFNNMRYPGDVTCAKNPLRGFRHTCSDFFIFFRISYSFRPLCPQLAQPYVFSLSSCYKVPICTWVCMLVPKVYHPSTLIPSCFGLAIISAPAYKNIIDAIGYSDELKHLAKVSYLFLPWSLYQIRSSWHFPVSDLYFWSISGQSIPQVISGSFCELRADLLLFLFYYM